MPARACSCLGDVFCMDRCSLEHALMAKREPATKGPLHTSSRLESASYSSTQLWAESSE